MDALRIRQEKGLFDIRYVKLHFTAMLMENTRLPVNKVSALRGGMGEMLLRANCIRDRHCEACDFESECIVRRTMYSKMEVQPAFMSGGDSVGYVLECEDYREAFEKGDCFNFQLLLFGKTIVYFSQYMNAFFALGESGLGKEKSRFQIVSVTNSRKETILDGKDVYMREYRIQTVKEYVEYRERQLTGTGGLVLKFKSPLYLKFLGEVLEEFRIEPILTACRRRLYMLDCFEGIICDVPPGRECRELPEELEEFHRKAQVRRFSNRTGTGMEFRGIEGTLSITRPDPELLKFLIAGELMHIGKNTSFGFGRFRISKDCQT